MLIQEILLCGYHSHSQLLFVPILQFGHDPAPSDQVEDVGENVDPEEAGAPSDAAPPPVDVAAAAGDVALSASSSTTAAVAPAADSRRPITASTRRLLWPEKIPAHSCDMFQAFR